MPNITIPYEESEKQALFHASSATETFYGGSKGAGKSCALTMDCLAYCLEFPGATAYLFRETYDDLESNLISEWKLRVPKELYKYNESKHDAVLKNGSIVHFRYVSNYQDAEHYQGRSMDYLGIDELTRHEEKVVQELLSCLRSAKGFPPTFKATGNPGGKGHRHVKKRYITGTNYGQKEYTDLITGNRISFIPAKVYDNPAIMKNDPAYVRRLENLPEAKRQAFLLGNWDVYTGQAFPEWNEAIHVCDNFDIPPHWKRWRCLDNGYADPFYWGWLAVSPEGIVYLYREFTRDRDDPRLLYTEQAQKAAEKSKYIALEGGIPVEIEEKIAYTVAGVDAWNTHHRDQSGKSLVDYYMEGGISGLVKAVTDRKLRKDTFHEYLNPIPEIDPKTGKETGKYYAKLQVMKRCKTFIELMPELVEDEDDPELVADCDYDHCLTGDTIINTVSGDFAIKDLIGKTGVVHCFDEEIQKATESRFYGVRCTAKNTDVYQIEMEDGRIIKATDYHPILTPNGWKLLKDLIPGEEIIDICDHT